MSFNMMIKKDGKSCDKITVKCHSCNKIKIITKKEHTRNCKRQSEFIDVYLCTNCYRLFKKDINNQSCKKAWSTNERKKLASKASNVFWNSLNKNQRLMHSKKGITKDRNQKISEIIKKKFKNSQYINNVKKARKLYWKNPTYRTNKIKIGKKQAKNNIGIFQKNPYISKIQKILYDHLKNLNIKYISEYKIGYYRFDCFLPDFNILIECNGEYWHNTKKHQQNDKAKATFISRYHKDKIIKTLWEKDFLNPSLIIKCLLSWTNQKINIKPIKLKKLIIEPIDNKTATEFIQKYHYTYSLGHGRSQIRYGALLDNELVAVCCFASITRKETAIRLNIDHTKIKELNRLCANPFYYNKNLLSYFLSKCEKLLKRSKPDIDILVTFADTTFGHTGSVYKASNWIYDGKSSKSYWYLDKNGYSYHKKTIYNHAKKLKIKESQYAYKNCLKRIWGKEKNRFIKYLNK